MFRTSQRHLVITMLGLAACAPKRAVAPPEPHVAPNAPADAPVYATDTTVAAQLRRILAPCFARARETYPSAKQRYLEGLSGRRSFFVSINLRDADGRIEQVFLAVDTLRVDSIRGRIWNEVTLVRGFQLRQSIIVPESEVLDWMFTNLDGSEEGNYVGKAVDQLRAGQQPEC